MAASYNEPCLIALAQARERLSRYLYVMSHGVHMQTETPNEGSISLNHVYVGFGRWNEAIGRPLIYLSSCTIVV